ncbi:hypothetical protein M092_2784 [Parabacteroides distasonis str. 3776 D15 iv]|nr:hypothetical protein M092_2784 [Parabacteroides distasonis str. 3776 D15 iv]
MFVFCNGKIILFTEINNSKRGYPTFWTAPFFIVDDNKRYEVNFGTYINKLVTLWSQT